MSNRRIMQLFAMTAMMSDMGNLYSGDNRGNPLRPKDIDVKRPTPPTPNGMKDWCIDGYYVQAVTKKQAIKKVNKLKSEQ
jgi:hypothetical protein